MKNLLVKLPKRENVGLAFHEKEIEKSKGQKEKFKAERESSEEKALSCFQ